mgnify:FL=1
MDASKIRIDENDPDQVPPEIILACHFGPDHNGIDITSLADVETRLMCANCRAIGKAPLEPMFKPWSGRESR